MNLTSNAIVEDENTAINYSSMTNSQLKAELDSRNISYSKKANKSTLISLLQADE